MLVSYTALFQVCFSAIFTTCQNVGQLHSHSSKFLLGCIYNLPKCWLATQPLFQVFFQLYLQPAKILVYYTATFLKFCLVAFSYLWDIVWHLPNLSAAPSPTHLPCQLHCNPDPHSTVSQPINPPPHCWPTGCLFRFGLLADPFPHHPTVG